MPEGGMGGEPAVGAGGAGAGEGGAPTAVGGAGGEGGAPVVVEADTIDNPSFDQGNGDTLPISWTVTGTEGSALKKWNEANAHSGNGYLNLWLGTAYTVDVSQVVSPIPDGTYTVTLYQRGGTPVAYADQYVYVTGYDQANMSAEMTVDSVAGGSYTLLTIANIPVTSGQIEIGIYSDGPADAWSHFDDVTLTLSQ
jgi:arabinogalactan endo-1,4-beta-galactosidase